ncbi:Uma2 family endonuclease [Nostoc spongiaeforme FACHB-130]|uniref:Uma2 family endonuclease n=1 Tax=Nostoc spongiaeforme FACHB-130 TaxID=1357510 RepID=A0ABR8G398_9NOSO|nr:Uma2 family endonuclease [Nostoc spongiaeforme]MBD2597644.1 Uma2 family endonuclease [Nostoc spongiaeforme FACHB-130]
MIQAQRKLVTFAEFTQCKPEDGRYELHDGVIIKMPQPLGGHEEVIGFLVTKLVVEYERLQLPYFRPKTALVKPPENESAYSADILLLNRQNLINEPLWQKQSTVIYGASVPLIVEVVSTNWRDDYFKKRGEYEAIGIPEYWLVDYAALGGREFIGKPKQATILIFSLDEGEYQVKKFQGDELIQSPTFPELILTAQQIFQAGNITP